MEKLNDPFYEFPQQNSPPQFNQGEEIFVEGEGMEFKGREPDGGGAAADGFYFYFADETEWFIETGTVLENFNPAAPDNHVNWFIKLPVSGGAFDTSDLANSIEYVASVGGSTARFDGDASADPPKTQEYYLLPVIRGVDFGDGAEPQRVALGGAYEEDGFCAGDKGPIRRMIKIA